MHKIVPLIVAFTAALGTGGCAKGGDATGDAGQISDTIKAQEAQWVKDFSSRDVNAIDGHFASDGVAAGPGYVASTDVERRSLLSRWLTDPNFKLAFSPDRVDVAKSGDLAVSSGKFTLTYTDQTKKPADLPGAYLTVYKKQPDGSWKAVDRFLTQDPAPEAAAKATQ